jgi:hypothetical protein
MIKLSEVCLSNAYVDYYEFDDKQDYNHVTYHFVTMGEALDYAHELYKLCGQEAQEVGGKKDVFTSIEWGQCWGLHVTRDFKGSKTIGAVTVGLDGLTIIGTYKEGGRFCALQQR